MYTWTLSVLAVQLLPNLLSLLCSQHHIAVPLLLLILSFYGRMSVCLAVHSFAFSLALPLSTFPSPGPFFSLCGMLDYSSVIVIIALSDGVMRGLLSPSTRLREMWRVHFRNTSVPLHVCAWKAHTCFLSLCPFPHLRFSFSPFLFLQQCPSLPSRSMYTSFSRFPPHCQPCHLPISPLPSRVRSRVLTLGFVQICSLRGWEVVVRAKKNSLALSLDN